MPQISSGQAASLVLEPGESYTISATGVATVKGIYGAPATTTTLNSNFAVFGPYGVPAKLDIACTSGSASYTLDQYEGDVVRSKSNPFTGGNALKVGAELYPLGPSRYVGYEMEQPAEITGPVSRFGKLACRFGTGQWSIVSGTPALTQGYTGWDGAGNKTGPTSRTGQPDMLKVVPAANTTEQISLGSFATNMLVPNLGGKFGIWVYVENLTTSISVGVETGTAGVSSNCLLVSFTANQVRNGWNFLKFVMRDPQAYVDGTGVAEYHPFGVSPSNYGTGAATNIKDNPITYIRLQWENGLGCSMYFDSVWTDFESSAQVVLGCDGGINLEQLAVPIFQNYGWIGYHAAPIRVYSGGSKIISDLQSPTGTTNAQQQRLRDLKWDIVNHTANHLANGTLTAEGEIVYELETARAWQFSLDCVKGSEFYASPVSSTSILAEKVIKSMGFKLQRHARKWNVVVTPFGIDNPHHVGAIDMGSASATGVSAIIGGASSNPAGWQTASKIKRAIDVVVAYGDTIFPFWHGITTTGDTGTGEDLTGDNLLLTKSAFEQSMAYIRQLELNGSLRVCRGVTGFWYGV